MMGLGNGRRSIKSPPLILAALLACIVVLGFNYWIVSSRSVALQTRVLELEGRVRRAAAERGAVELKKNEFQGELKKQRAQLDKIQFSHSFQLDSVNKLHQDEKALLVNNITAGERLIRDLQDQLKALQRSYGRLQQDIAHFQRNQTSLEQKFSYDLGQCINQIREVKEQCEERIEEVTNKRNETVVSRDVGEDGDRSQQLQTLSQPQPKLQETDLPQGRGRMPSSGWSHTPAPSSDMRLYLETKKGNEETSEIQVVREQEEPSRDSLEPSQPPGRELATVEDTPGDRSGFEGAGQLGQTTQVPADLLAGPGNEDPEDLERDQLVVAHGGPEELDATEEGRAEQKPGDDDYNVDQNEAESERDKQAALSAEDQKRGTINLPDEREKQNFTLNWESYAPLQA